MSGRCLPAGPGANVSPPSASVGRFTVPVEAIDMDERRGVPVSVAADLPVTPAVTGYLRAILRLQGTHGAVTTQALADELAISAPSVTSMAKRLDALGLAHYTRYHGVSLTEAGEEIARTATYHHRVVELFLAESLGYRWEEARREAERLADVVSPDLVARIEAALGHPSFDGAGDRIPNQDDRVGQCRASRLLDLEIGVAAGIHHVRDHDPAHHRYLENLGLFPGVEVMVLRALPFDGPLLLRVGTTERLISRRLAAAVSVERYDADQGDAWHRGGEYPTA